jgi:hypothetical protein
MTRESTFRVDQQPLVQKEEIMPCTQEPVRMSGILSGNMQTAFCTVSALRVSLSGTRLFKNCLHSIVWVAKPLPDGDYKLSVEGEHLDMRLCKGGWQETRVAIGEVKPTPLQQL